MPGANVPFPPMEAELVRELPAGEGWQYEPKWDGFRGVLENDGGELALWSRNGRPLLRYFPELAPLGDLLPPHTALDGEIVIARDGVLEFDSMQMRLHPAESRVRKLAAEIPAIFIAFDLLLWDGEPVHERPLEERRQELLARGDGFWISPATTSLDSATAWLDRFEAAGLDGVIAKRLGLAYMPGSREAVVKVKEHKTADCVVIGVRWKSRPEKLATLLLGLYREDGEVDYVGSAAIGARNHDEIAARVATPPRRGLRAPLLGAEPLGDERARGDAASARARRRGALRQGAGEPLPPRHEADPLPRRQGPGAVHVARGAAGHGAPTTRRSRRCSAPPPEKAERGDVGEARERAELDVRAAVPAVRPLPRAHADDGHDHDVARERRRVDVDPLPVLIPSVAAEAPDHVAPATEQEQEGRARS